MFDAEISTDHKQRVNRKHKLSSRCKKERDR